MKVFARVFCLLGTVYSLSFDVIELHPSVNSSVIEAVNHYLSDTVEVSVIDETGCDYSWLTSPVTYYTSFGQRIPQDITGSTKGYLLRRGFFVCTTERRYQEVLRHIYVHNPVARTVLMIENITVPLGDMFAYAWQLLRLINVLIVSASSNEAFLCNPYNQTLVPAISDVVIDRFVDDIYRNMQLYPMRVNKFQTIQLCDDEDHRYNDPTYLSVCGELMDCYRRAMNFTVVRAPAYDIPDFGFLLENGTFIGALGDIEYDRADVSVVSRMIISFTTAKNIYFTHAIFVIRYQFVVPNDFYVIEFEVMPHRFMSVTVLILISVVVTVLICLHFLSERSRLSFMYVAMIYISTYANTSIVFRPRFFSTRLVYSMILLLALIVSSIYTGSIITELNKSGGSANIQSIDQLLSTNLQLRVPNGVDQYIHEYEKFPEGTTQKRVFERMEITEISSAIQIFHAALRRTAAILCMDHFFYSYQSQFLSNVTGRSLIYAVPQSAYMYYTSVILQRRSPFIERFNYITLRSIEGFLPRMQYNKGLYRLQMNKIRRARDGLLRPETMKTIGLKEVTTLFQYYLIALAASLVVFVLELVVYRVQRILEIRRLNQKLRQHDRFSCEICRNKGRRDRQRMQHKRHVHLKK